MGSCTQLHLPNPNFLPFYSVNRSQEVALRQCVQKLSILSILFETFPLLTHNITFPPQKQRSNNDDDFSLKRKRNCISIGKKKKKKGNSVQSKVQFSSHGTLFPIAERGTWAWNRNEDTCGQNGLRGRVGSAPHNPNSYFQGHRPLGHGEET